MQRRFKLRAGTLLISLTLAGLVGCSPRAPEIPIQLGPRPFYLLDQLAEGPLRTRLDACRGGPFRPARFSIGHRGAPLQFPEHTRDSYLAAVRMGAGVLECDVTLTSDRALVCRHDQCDLATTTNILETPLADRCRTPFAPAQHDPATGGQIRPARAECCTSDLTLAEFRTLEARMDGRNPSAKTSAEFASGTPSWRTDLYSNHASPMTLEENLALAAEAGVEIAPELKEVRVDGPLGPDFDRRAVALALVRAVRDAGFAAKRVRLQSFREADLRIWLEAAPEFGARAVWLIDEANDAMLPNEANLEARFAEGFRVLGLPISALLSLGPNHSIVPSDFSRRARAVGFELIAWTMERSGRIHETRVEGEDADFYLGPIQPALTNDGDVFRILDVLAQDVGVLAVFSDWPATATYYANCLGLD